MDRFHAGHADAAPALAAALAYLGIQVFNGQDRRPDKAVALLHFGGAYHVSHVTLGTLELPPYLGELSGLKPAAFSGYGGCAFFAHGPDTVVKVNTSDSTDDPKLRAICNLAFLKEIAIHHMACRAVPDGVVPIRGWCTCHSVATGKFFIGHVTQRMAGAVMAQACGDYRADAVDPALAARAAAFLRSMATRLAAAHIVHHDLHLGNVLLDAHSNLFLTDFGEAALLDPARDNARAVAAERALPRVWDVNHLRL